jgi:hypothetical protein
MPQGLKPTLCCSTYAGLEGPRFHGSRNFRIFPQPAKARGPRSKI